MNELVIYNIREYKNEGMELLKPPPSPPPRKFDPKPATRVDTRELVEQVFDIKSITGTASLFDNACAGHDSYENNCAHFLSDAFIRAGYSELLSSNDCINARCGTEAHRPLRARDMWCWFKQKATQTKNALPKNDGFWVVFQLNENEYWGGHVVIIDTTKNLYYGTGNYPQWDQYAYKW
jgi:hypothetical protein